MKVTPKGQITIPQPIREQLGISPGTEIDIAVDGRTLRLTPRRHDTPTIDQIINQMRGKGDVRMATDEIMRLTRGD